MEKLMEIIEIIMESIRLASFQPRSMRRIVDRIEHEPTDDPRRKSSLRYRR